MDQQETHPFHEFNENFERAGEYVLEGLEKIKQEQYSEAVRHFRNLEAIRSET